MAFPRPKPTTADTLAMERADPPFNVRALAAILHGGEQQLVRKERFMAEFARSPTFRLDDVHDLSLGEVRERAMAKFAAMVHYVTTESVETFQERMTLLGTADPGFWTRFGVHYGLFLGALRGGATPAQLNYWVDKGVLGLNGVIGCFGMTELAHGSNVAGLETTATFDINTDEIVIHTPHIGATKWWIGGAASTATHCAVFAQLIVNGKRHGVKTFVVQLRDVKSFDLMPGVNITDIGKKMGRDSIDNGAISFTYVRIPRSHMLMKHTKLSRNGDVLDPPLAQLAYGALIGGRVGMVSDSSNAAKKALTIAIRYAAVRRQFSSDGSKLETQILDYPIHQRRLMPLLAQAVATGFTALRLEEMYRDMTASLETLEPSDPNLQDVLEKLKETHATAAGLKAFCTWACLSAIDTCRQCCGGHGYSAYSGFPSMYSDFAVQCTWEGDNTILSLQSGRALIGSYSDASRGKKLAPGVAYLARPGIYTAKSNGKLDLEDIDNGWACVAANFIKKVASDYKVLAEKKGATKESAMEGCSQGRFIAAKVHTIGYIFRMFRAAVEDLPLGPEREVLTLACKLYGIYQIEEQAGGFLKYGYFAAEQMDQVSSEVNDLCAKLREVAVPLVDSFALSDHIINSPLGRYDGQIYEAYFDHVRRSNPPQKIHPYFDRLIKPLLERKLVDEDGIPAISAELDEEVAEAAAEIKAAKQKKSKKD